MKLFYNCSKANNVCDKNQYKEASFLELVALNLHLVWCKFCRNYSANNNKLTKLIQSSEIKTMPATQKEILKKRLQKKINNQ